MNTAFDGGRRRRGTANPGIGNLVGDPFALATVSIAALGWIIVLVGSIISQIRDSPFDKFIWWVVAFELICIVGVTAVITTDTREVYHVAIVGFLAVGGVFSTLSVNELVYKSTGEEEAAAVGFILLSIVTFVWIWYFGSTPAAAHRGYFDSIALGKDQQRVSTRQSRPMSTNNYDRPRTTASGHQPQNLYTSAQLNGFETSSPVSGYPGGAAGVQDRNGSQPRFQGTSPARSPTTAQPPAENTLGADVGAPTEYPYRAKAIYSYEANPDDANEISFTKHEILEVSDVSGRWWQAKKENGETGIAPSNYLILL